jgi:hypothetical protein
MAAKVRQSANGRLKVNNPPQPFAKKIIALAFIFYPLLKNCWPFAKFAQQNSFQFRQKAGEGLGKIFSSACCLSTN